MLTQFIDAYTRHWMRRVNTVTKRAVASGSVRHLQVGPCDTTKQGCHHTLAWNSFTCRLHEMSWRKHVFRISKWYPPVIHHNHDQLISAKSRAQVCPLAAKKRFYWWLQEQAHKNQSWCIRVMLKWNCSQIIGGTRCGLVTPHGDVELGQHWLRKWLVAWRHQAIPEPVLSCHQ